MKIRTITIALLLLAARGFGADQFVWQTDKPEAQGMSTEKLDAMRDGLAAHGTTSLIVVRHDKIVYEWYAKGWSADKPHGTASMAKAMIGGVSLAVAIQDGRLKADDPASKYIPQWSNDPVKSKITVAQLATHTSGLDDAEDDDKPHDQLIGWKGEFWKREPTDPFTLSRDSVPLIDKPGKRVSYSNPGMAMLSYTITAAIQPGEQKDIRALLRDRVFAPIGIGDKEWTIGYGKPSRVEGMDIFACWGGASFVPRAAARLGRLMLHEGDWDGRRIIDAAVVRATVNPTGTPPREEWEGAQSPSPGFGWWSNRDNAWKSVPRDTYLAAGAGDQRLVVIPSLDIVAVRNGSGLADPRLSSWPATEKLILAPLAAAVTDAPAAVPPYPPSKVIHTVRFDDESTIIRKAPDSDNWPITWGDDDQLYTSYGDGHGFEPLIKPKLSLGFARVEGSPPDFQGINIRSETGERTGGGAKGAKSSGMLMVDGTLYMFVRNTNNSTLAWSTDHGVTWTWGFTFDTSFGCPALLNFGRNYAGARDGFLYIYSQDGPGAYDPYDNVVMARVPKQKMQDRSAYEFCTGVGADGSANWSSDLAARAPVFCYPGHCCRIDAVFDSGIKRYLMAMSFGAGRGWGIFDAPEPWGPWTTAYATTDWDQGDTHGYRIPSKWISADGKELYLVFSGSGPGNPAKNDAFCVRRFMLDVTSR
jgi:CubicO group peptidase (beta-lactamase class C family)